MRYMDKKLKLIISVSVVFIVAASIALLYVRNENVGITAREGLAIADDVAQEWNTSARLVTIYSIGGVSNSGMCNEWRYTYANFSQSSNSSRALEVIVSHDETWVISELEGPPTPNTITNWSLDSDQIINFAKNELHVNQYLNKYPNAKIDTMALSSRSDNQHIWYILWSDSGFMDDPHSAVIKLDANTGVVLYVDVQL